MTRATAALLGAALLAVGLVGHETGAQPAPPTRRRPRVARIVLVQVAMPVAEMTETGTFALRAFFAELRRVGWVEGQNLVIERRSGEGWTARYPELAREVVGLKPDVIVAGSTRLVRALKAATTTVPVVAVMFTPVEAGLVASLARPGGNITGVSVDAGIEVLGFRRLAVYVDRVLRGAKAADLPIEQPTTLDFVVNLKTAKALGLSIPQPVLLRATEVIDR